MTVAVSLKVQDGLVLAADSASTLLAPQPDGSSAVVNVYPNANKIVNLYKGLPLGVMTWGSGSIGGLSVASICKDLREMFVGAMPGPEGEDWKLDPEDFTVEAVASRVRGYTHSLYCEAFGSWSEPPALGMIVAGYSRGSHHAEEYKIEMSSEGCDDPSLVRPVEQCGYTVAGQPNAVSRLVNGVDPMLGAVLADRLGVSKEQVPSAVAIIGEALAAPLVQDAMPFQDALDLAEFFVDLTVRYTRFMPGPATVGGPIEVAGITKHEGFKWIKRKHYYDAELNPREAPWIQPR